MLFFPTMKTILVKFAQFAGAVKYTGVKKKATTTSVLIDTKLPDGDVPIILELWGMQSTPFFASALRSTLAWGGSN